MTSHPRELLNFSDKLWVSRERDRLPEPDIDSGAELRKIIHVDMDAFIEAQRSFRQQATHNERHVVFLPF